MQTTANVNEGRKRIVDNRTPLKPKLKTAGLKLKVNLKAGGCSLNHNGTLVRDDVPSNNF